MFQGKIKKSKEVQFYKSRIFVEHFLVVHDDDDQEAADRSHNVPEKH